MIVELKSLFPETEEEKVKNKVPDTVRPDGTLNRRLFSEAPVGTENRISGGQAQNGKSITAADSALMEPSPGSRRTASDEVVRDSSVRAVSEGVRLETFAVPASNEAVRNSSVRAVSEGVRLETFAVPASDEAVRDSSVRADSEELRLENFHISVPGTTDPGVNGFSLFRTPDISYASTDDVPQTLHSSDVMQEPDGDITGDLSRRGDTVPAEAAFQQDQSSRNSSETQISHGTSFHGNIIYGPEVSNDDHKTAAEQSSGEWRELQTPSLQTFADTQIPGSIRGGMTQTTAAFRSQERTAGTFQEHADDISVARLHKSVEFQQESVPQVSPDYAVFAGMQGLLPYRMTADTLTGSENDIRGDHNISQTHDFLPQTLPEQLPADAVSETETDDRIPELLERLISIAEKNTDHAGAIVELLNSLDPFSQLTYN